MNNSKDFDNKKISSLIVTHLYLMYSKNMLVATNKFFFEMNDLLNLVSFFILGIFYLYIILRTRLIKRIIGSKALLLILFIICFFTASCLVDNDLFSGKDNNYLRVKESLLFFFSYGFPLFVLTASLTDMCYLWEKLKKHVNLIYCVAFISFLFSLGNFETSDIYSMSYGYAVMPLSIIIFIKYINSHNKFLLIQFLTTLLFIFSAGSRGPLVCIFVSLVLLYIFKLNDSNKRILTMIQVSILSVAVYFNIETVAYIANAIFEKLGIHSRTLWMIEHGVLTADSGRSYIYQTLLLALEESPLFGLGAFASEKIIAQAHGLYIDIFVNFGYLFGILMLALLFYQIYIMLVKSRGTYFNELIILLVSASLAKGLFAGGLWIDKDLWMIFGVLFGNYYKWSIKKLE